MKHAILTLGMIVAASAEQIPVRISGSSLTSTPPVAMARMRATEILARSGVQLQWCGQCRDRANSIWITFLDAAPAEIPEGIMAQAYYAEGRQVRIFADRVERAAGKSMFSAVLAHVLVHEIVHLIQATGGHAATGIMKQRWDSGDYNLMRSKSLRLTETDEHLLHAGLLRRRSPDFAR